MITRDMCRAIRPEIEAALKEVSERFGMTIKTGNAKFTDCTISMKLEMNVEGHNREAEEFKRNALRLGLRPDDLGCTFDLGGGVYEITGARMRRHAYPISAKRRHDGKGFKFSAHAVRTYLGRP